MPLQWKCLTFANSHIVKCTHGKQTPECSPFSEVLGAQLHIKGPDKSCRRDPVLTHFFWTFYTKATLMEKQTHKTLRTPPGLSWQQTQFEEASSYGRDAPSYAEIINEKASTNENFVQFFNN